MESTGGWEVIEWPKNQLYPRTVSHEFTKLLLEEEEVITEGYGVVLVNTDEEGTLLVTNYRLLFVSEKTRDVNALGTIPLAVIEKFNKLVIKQTPDKSARRLLQVFGKDLRTIVFSFRPGTKQMSSVFEALLRCTRPARLWDIYAFTCGPSKYGGSNPKVRLLDEYFRLLGIRSKYHASEDMIDEGSFNFSNDWWRITNTNSNYSLCTTYPFAMIFPKSITDQEVLQASSFRAKCRLPVISWCDPATGAVLARSSQPLVGFMNTRRSDADEKLVAALCTQSASAKNGPRKLYIADARPRKNALVNGARGGGSESSSNYFHSEVVFFGIDNIYAMSESLSRVREYLDTYGTTSSDGTSSYLRRGGATWPNLSSMSNSVSTLSDSLWLTHIQNVLAGAAWITARIANESTSVLVHCSDGWDRTAQLVSLASLLLDPYYRTFQGFQALVEKDWLSFGHPFSHRIGLPDLSASGDRPSELMRQSSLSKIHSCVSSPGPSNTHSSNNYSPIFLQWIDCVSQLLRMYPFAFEFSSVFLVDFLDCVLSCRFGNFLCNSENERQQSRVSESCGCLWTYLTGLRAFNGRSHPHYNFFYNQIKHEGPLLPPAAFLAPTLLPQFHLRWACPKEVEAGDLEAISRNMAYKFSELQKVLYCLFILLPIQLSKCRVRGSPVVTILPSRPIPRVTKRFLRKAGCNGGLSFPFVTDEEVWRLRVTLQPTFAVHSEPNPGKETAERKTSEITAAVESLALELRNEKHQSNTALNLAKKASKEFSKVIFHKTNHFRSQVHFFPGLTL